MQTWRSVHFKKQNLDSILSLTFEDTNCPGLIMMVCANGPDHQAESLEKGWHQHYWKPWKDYLSCMLGGRAGVMARLAHNHSGATRNNAL